MIIQSTNLKNLATLVEKDIESGEADNDTLESNAALNNNKTVVRFLNDKNNAKLYIKMSKSTCSAYKKGVGHENCAKCVGKCSEYFYINEISKRIVKTKAL